MPVFKEKRSYVYHQLIRVCNIIIICTRTLTALTMSRLAPLLVKTETTSLCPFFAANITGENLS